jgi:hypothetical protein
MVHIINKLLSAKRKGFKSPTYICLVDSSQLMENGIERIQCSSNWTAKCADALT